MRKVSFKTIRGEVGSPTYDNWDVGAQMAIERLEDDLINVSTSLHELWFETRKSMSPEQFNHWHERLKVIGLNPSLLGIERKN